MTWARRSDGEWEEKLAAAEERCKAMQLSRLDDYNVYESKREEMKRLYESSLAEADKESARVDGPRAQSRVSAGEVRVPQVDRGRRAGL